MKKSLLLLLVLVNAFVSFGQKAQKISGNKKTVLESVDRHTSELVDLSDKIWEAAEIALKENVSAKALADYAEAQGFTVERGVAEMPTAFIASYGSGKPIIGIMGEYDALPGLSQKAVPEKSPLIDGAGGHGCGHNLFGPGSLGAAVAIKELIEQGKLKGTVRFYGTPAEEAIGGKIYMARAGLFNDLDACLDWHPDAENKASTQSSQAMIEVTVEFTGQAAHAAFDPWNGRSALDAVEAFVNGLNMLREHIKPSVRIHYIIEKGGEAPNIVPDYARVGLYVRDATRDGMMEVYKRVQEIGEGAALIAGVTPKLTITSGYHEQLPNIAGANVLYKNMQLVGPISYTADEIAFAKGIQRSVKMEEKGLDGTIGGIDPTAEFPTGGSTDVADISWITPEISLVATTAPIGTPWHSWAVVACGGMSIGHKGMVFAAKSLALTMVDLFENEAIRKAMRDEFVQKKGDYVYKAILPEGPPPVK
ncbi:amidohydrolase [uncultured Imperialibacter sp.]|uniref:amidohydrolase n=1 Tax=uncultured Imperialibacter sp. TaxID=1672639 RepID=UPI0030D72C77|tara:strand:+ start:62533 stop:63966 length:1434 start_codon:yes stop_codon:yes gene_type:complete